MMHVVQSTIGTHVHVRSITLDQMSCQFGNYVSVMYMLKSSSPFLRITTNIHVYTCMFACISI